MILFAKGFLKAFNRTLGILFLFIALGLYFDSRFFIDIYDQGQWIANGLMVAVYILLLYRGTNRSRELMIYATLIGIAGEYLFSLGFEMYTYRLGNVPWYVPPGHAIIYISAVYFCREAFIKFNRSKIEQIFKLGIFFYSFFFLVVYFDVFGFVLTLISLWILKNKPRERLFYYSMYIVVAFLEIVGTRYACWFWPDEAFGIFSFLPSANPPSGISFFYFGLDLGSLWLYKQRHKIAWGRMKSIRTMKETSIV